MVTRKVAAAERKPVVKLTGNYRQFCEQRRQLSALEEKIQDRLDQYEKALLHEARKPLAFLAIPPRLSAKNKPALQTRRPRRKQPM
jgi:hypothetical protein